MPPTLPPHITHVSHASGPSLLTAAGAWLERAEAENNLIVSLAARNASYSRSPSLWLTLLDDAQSLVGVAIQTPPHNLLVTSMPLPVAYYLADVLVASNATLPGVIGPSETAHAFADAWCARRGVVARVLHEQRIYQLTSVIKPATQTGVPRTAEARDRPLMLEWTVAMRNDAGLPSIAEDRVARDVDARIATGSIFVLEANGEPVSMAMIVGQTTHGARIGMVYTPAKHRRSGHASTLVAAVSQRVLDSGRTACFLYTDLANPTSNAIYQRIGYRAVSDAPMIGFE